MANQALAEYRREWRDGWDLWNDRTRLPAEWWGEVRGFLSGSNAVMARSRHAVTTLVELTGSAGPLRAYLKAYHRCGHLTDLKDALRDSKALRALRISLALERDGFLVPRHLAAGERRGGRLVKAAFLLTLAVDAPTLQRAPEGWVGRPPGEQRQRKRALLRLLGAEVGRLHCRGYAAGDLLVTNILVEPDPPARFWFIDHDRSRRARWFEGERPFRRNLIQLNRIKVPGVTHADRYRVLAAYAQTRGWDRERLRTEARRLAGQTLRRRAFLKRLATRRKSPCATSS